MSGISPRMILLVEDESLIAMAEKNSLERYGYGVKVVNSGEKAVEAIEAANSIDLILMDIDLGAGMDGTEAAARILRHKDLPIVFLSSHIEPEIVERTENITSYGYVVKNSTITVLDASIKMAFKLFNANSKIVQMHEKIEATLDAIPDLLFEVGLDGYYYDIHAHDAQLLFKPAAELIGRRMQEVLPSSIADTMMSAVVEAYEKGSSSGRQYELTVPAGQFWFELSVSIKARDSEDPRFIILARNITERKQFERAIQEKESHFESLFANAPVGIVYSTLEGKIISINAEYARILGYASPEEAKELINQTSLSEAVYASPKNRAILLDQIRNAPGSWVRTEQPFRRKDGDIVVAKAVFRASPDNCEVLEGFLEESSLPRQ